MINEADVADFIARIEHLLQRDQTLTLYLTADMDGIRWLTVKSSEEAGPVDVYGWTELIDDAACWNGVPPEGAHAPGCAFYAAQEAGLQRPSGACDCGLTDRMDGQLTGD